MSGLQNAEADRFGLRLLEIARGASAEGARR
jgi:hypothetical protein